MSIKLPNPIICHTARLLSTNFFMCLVEPPLECPHLSIIRDFHICNNYIREQFAEVV